MNTKVYINLKNALHSEPDEVFKIWPPPQSELRGRYSPIFEYGNRLTRIANTSVRSDFSKNITIIKIKVDNIFEDATNIIFKKLDILKVRIIWKRWTCKRYINECNNGKKHS